MIHAYKYKNLTWVDVESPTEEEIIGLVKEYHIHTLIGEDILSEYSRARIERYPDYIYMVLKIPVRLKTNLTHEKHRRKVVRKYIVEEKEVDFVIGRNFMITSHIGALEPLMNFAKIFETNSIVTKRKNAKTADDMTGDGMGDHAGFIFYYLMKRIYAHMENDLEEVRESLMNAEAAIFDGNEKRMVRVLSNISRELIDLKQSSRVHKEVIEAFAPAAQGFFGQDFKFQYVDDIVKQYNKIHELTGNDRELLIDLRETNDSLLSTKQNEIMQTLTIVASIIFPLDLVTGIFSMNTAYTPIVGTVHDFATIMVILAVIALAMVCYFKYKRWV